LHYVIPGLPAGQAGLTGISHIHCFIFDLEFAHPLSFACPKERGKPTCRQAEKRAGKSNCSAAFAIPTHKKSYKEAKLPKTASSEGQALCGGSIVFGLLFFAPFFCRSKRKERKIFKV